MEEPLDSEPGDALDWQSLRTIRAIADHGSITAAARHLGFSQPAISQQVRRIEQRLQALVLVRTGRTVTLTEVGEILARHATTVTRVMNAAAEEIAAVTGLRAANVRVAAFPSSSVELVPTAFAMLKRGYPGISITSTETEPAGAIDMLRRGVCDLAVTFSYPDDRADPHDEFPGLVRLPLFSDSLVIALPREHRLASHDNTVALSELAGESWIAGCANCRGNLLQVCDAAGFSPTIAFETESALAELGMVAAGLGVALVPQLAIRTSHDSRVRLMQPQRPIMRTVQIAVTEDLMRVPAVGATIAAFQRAVLEMGMLGAESSVTQR